MPKLGVALNVKRTNSGNNLHPHTVIFFFFNFPDIKSSKLGYVELKFLTFKYQIPLVIK